MSREAPKIGLDNVYIAKVLSDTADGIVYDTPIALKGAVNISINPNSSVDTDYADNGAFVSMNNRGVVDATLEMIDVDNAIISQMLGQTYSGGVVTEKSLDQSPYFAMMFRVMVAGSDATPVYHLFCYAKGRFSVPETTADTKKDTIDFGHTTLNAQFINTIYDNKIICSHCRTDDTNTPASTISNWFVSPILAGTYNLTSVVLSLDPSSTSTEFVINGSIQGGYSFNFVEASMIKGSTVIAFDENGGYINGVNITLDQNSPVANPKFRIRKWTSANAIKTVMVTAGVKSSTGGSVTPIEFTIE